MHKVYETSNNNGYSLRNKLSLRHLQRAGFVPTKIESVVKSMNQSNLDPNHWKWKPSQPELSDMSESLELYKQQSKKLPARTIRLHGRNPSDSIIVPHPAVRSQTSGKRGYLIDFTL